MGGRMLCILLHRIPYPTVVPAAFGVVYKPDPFPNPSLREGLSAASGKIGVSDGRCKLVAAILLLT